ncbi:MAG: BtrH N-terminal domain-containing protein [Caldilineaceae bacterium]
MPTLTNYHHFAGRHWETGTLHNYYAYRGVKAPHTGQPYSEALFLGVSGGIVLGYFTFAYEGHDPHVALLTRNTFDPLDTMLSRLGVVQEVLQTSKPERGLQNLLETLAEGLPAMVWADMWSLPYNALSPADAMWAMRPLIVYGYEEAADQVWIADRANVPLTVTTGELAAARGRVKQDKHRVVTLDQPDPEKLAAAVTAGIWDCINLYTEKPPKGSANNFGLKAFRHWADLLTKPKQRMSWAKEFPAGVKFYAGLTTTFSHYGSVGINGDADRSLYATFLDEASIILNKPPLQEVAQQFRASGEAWRELGRLLLPEAIPLLRETRLLLEQKQRRFVEQGGETTAERQAINERLQAIRSTMISAFPLSERDVTALCEGISTQVLHIHDLEKAAIHQLRTIMA